MVSDDGFLAPGLSPLSQAVGAPEPGSPGTPADPGLHASQRTERKDRQLGERTTLQVISLMHMLNTHKVVSCLQMRTCVGHHYNGIGDAQQIHMSGCPWWGGGGGEQKGKGRCPNKT